MIFSSEFSCPVISGDPEASVLGPRLCPIFMYDLFVDDTGDPVPLPRVHQTPDTKRVVDIKLNEQLMMTDVIKSIREIEINQITVVLPRLSGC